MEVFTKADGAKMGHLEWEAFLAEKVTEISDARSQSFEWTKIKAAVDKDGDNGNFPPKYNHYIPYKILRNALEKTLIAGDKTRGGTCDWLRDIVDQLYEDRDTFAFEELKQPPKPSTERTRRAASAWITWALEAICDYPDNIFYGPGTGDGSGTEVDDPNGKGEEAEHQRKRMRVGAKKLRTAFKPLLDDVVDANGNPLK